MLLRCPVINGPTIVPFDPKRDPTDFRVLLTQSKPSVRVPARDCPLTRTPGPCWPSNRLTSEQSPPTRHRRTEPVGRAGPPRGSAGWGRIGLRLPVSSPVFAGLSPSRRLIAAAALPAAGRGRGGAPALSTLLFPPPHSRQKPPREPPRPPCAESPLFKLYFRKTGDHHLHT